MKTPTNSILWMAVTSCVAASLLTPDSARAQSGSWNVDADGNWSDTANWAGGPPGIIADGADFTATFGNVIAADRVVTLDSDRTIGNITASDTSHNYTISSAIAEILTLDRTDATSPTLNVTTAAHTLTISSVIAGNDGVLKTGDGTLQMTGANTFTGGVNLSAGRINVFDNANEQSFLGAASNTLTFTGNATLHNNNLAVTLPQNIAINGGVTASLTGAFGESTDVNGVLSGSGTMVVQGFSAGWNIDFLNTANTFTGAIEVRSGDGARLGMRSLTDSANTISLQSNGNSGGNFEYLSGAASALVLNSRQFELITNGNSGTNLDRQAKITSSAATANTITINTDLAITGTGNKTLQLGGGNTGDNAFNGNIIDAIGTSVLTLQKRDAGKWILGGQNTYEGNTEIQAGTLELADNASLRFVIGDTGVNNAILGESDAGAEFLNVNGDFVFDLTGAGTTVGNSWNIVGSCLLYAQREVRGGCCCSG